MNSNRKYTSSLTEAKKLFKLKTGVDYSNTPHYSGIKLFKLKIMKTKTRTYFVGTYIEWLNL